MNKKGSIMETLLYIVLICAIIILTFHFLEPTVTNYKAYQEFCEARPTFCYCSILEGGCEFKTSSQTVCINEDCGSKTLDEDTKELCKLAKELDDKKIMFKAGCE